MPIQVSWPAALAKMDPASRHLTLALAASTLLHAGILSLHFGFPQALKLGRESMLDIILVNSRSAERPTDVQARAQTNLDGGGNTDEDRRAQTPLPAADTTLTGDDLVDAKRRVITLERLQHQMLTQTESKKSVAAAPQKTEPTPPTPDTTSGLDLADRALAIAKLEAQIERQVQEYNQRPRRKTIGVRAESAVEAQYLEDWRQKIERIGNLNYPEAAKGKLYGSLVVWVEIKSNGELDNLEIRRSSGQKILDDAAMRIVRMSAPFSQFSQDLKHEMDIIGFARTWTFTRSDELNTSQ
jgi:protein TonB